jgi:hypothetical protein
MGFTMSDGGGVRTNLDYDAKDAGSRIAPNDTYAQNMTGLGVFQGPKDTPPSGSGGSAGGNGITTNGTVMGLDANGNTVAAQGH